MNNMDKFFTSFILVVLFLFVALIGLLIRKDSLCNKAGGVYMDSTCYEASSLRVLPIR